MNRGQAHTLEAVVGAMLLLASVAFALQMTAVTPLSASTSSQHVENQLQSTADGVLASAADSDALSRAVRYWNPNRVRHHQTGDESYYTSPPPETLEFSRMLQRTFNEQGVAYNVYLRYEGQDGEMDRRRWYYSGDASDHAVSARTYVTIVDDDPILQADGSARENMTVTDAAANFFAPDVASGSDRGLYSLVEVEVIAWRL